MSRPLLCVTVTATTTAELRRRRDEASAAGADLVELRLDSVADPNVAGALAGRRGPVIVTCRPTWEGGAFSGPEDERRALLAEALSRGAEYVDIEANVVYTLARRSEELKYETKFVGFDAPHEFLVGYGLDHAESFRHIPYIASLL